jgi:hypothetical protein
MHLLTALLSVPMLLAMAAPAPAATAQEKPPYIALVHSMVTTLLPDGQPSGPALTVTIDGTVVATEITFGAITPLRRLSPGEHQVQIFLPDVPIPIQEHPIQIPAGNRYDLVLGQSPGVGAGLPYLHVFTNQAGAPNGKIRLSLRNVSGVPQVSILIFGPYTPPALQNVPRGQEGTALLAATFSELKVLPSLSSGMCEAWFMQDFPDKTAVVIYAASPGLPEDPQQPCAFGAVLRWV